MEIHPAFYTIGYGILKIAFFGLVLRVAVSQNAGFKLNIWHAFGITIITMIATVVGIILLIVGLSFVIVDQQWVRGWEAPLIKMIVGFCVAIPIYMRIIHHPETGPLKLNRG